MKYLKKIDWKFVTLLIYALVIGFIIYNLLKFYSTIDEEGKSMISVMSGSIIMSMTLVLWELYKTKKSMKKLNIANNLFNSGQYIDALIAYSKITHVSTRRFVLHNSGLCLENLKCYEEAIMYYDDVISTNPSFLDAYRHKAICLDFLKKYDEALLTVDQAIVLNNNIYLYHYLKAQILKSIGKNELAAKSFHDGLKVDNENNDITFSVYILLYSLYRDMKMDDKALNLCEEAIQRIPNRQKFYVYKSALLYNEGLDQNQMQLGFDILLLGLKNNQIENKQIYDQIISYRSGFLGNDSRFNELYENYQNLFREFPNNYYYGLWGDTLYNLKEYNRALEKYSLVDPKKVESPIYLSVLLQTINCYMNLRNFNEMLIQCNEGLITYKGNNDLMIFKMIALNMLGDYNESLEIANLIDFSSNQQSLYVKFDCFFKLKKYQEVLDGMESLHNEDLLGIDFLNMKGSALKHLKKYDESLKLFNNILTKDSKSFMTYINKGSLLIEQKKYEDALSDFNYVINHIDQGEKNYGYLLGMTYLGCAYIYLLWENDLDKVFDNIEKAIQHYDGVRKLIIDDKDYDIIRDDDRYKKLMSNLV